MAASEFTDLPRFPAGFELAEALAEAAQQLHEKPTSTGTLHTAAELAVRLLPGAEHAGVSVIERGNRRRAVAWTDEVVRSAEARDQDREPHPLWERLWTTPVVRMEDSEADGGATPWPVSGCGRPWPCGCAPTGAG